MELRGLKLKTVVRFQGRMRLRERLCNMAFKSCIVTENWKTDAIVPFYKGKWGAGRLYFAWHICLP